jgi:hypothetical protein
MKRPDVDGTDLVLLAGVALIVAGVAMFSVG